MEKELVNNAKSNIYPFHMPGHKRRGAAVLGDMRPYDIDITEIDGYDNLHHAEGIIKQAQNEAAQLYGAKHAYFLINGSTCGILAAVSAAVGRGSRILVARNCHKAVYHAIYLRQLSPVFIYPQITASGIQGQITADEVKAAFDSNPDIGAVVITSPTYDGVVSDVATIAQIAHSHGAILIVDEAHGAHFGFGGGFPENAIKLGADAVVLSLHKTLPAFTQTALLVLGDCDGIKTVQNLPYHKLVEKFLGIYETSSPSYVLMAGIERCIHYVRDNGEAPFVKLREELDKFYHKTEELKYLRVVTQSDFAQEEADEFDESKILIFTDRTAISGQELIERLLHGYGIQLEMAAGSYALALCSVFDTEEGFERLAAALKDIDDRIECEKTKPEQKNCRIDTSIYQTLPAKLKMYEAYESNVCPVSFENAAGRISGAFVNLYPPGIPLVVPGEVINEKLVSDISHAIFLNMEVDGLHFNEKEASWEFLVVTESLT